MLKLSNVCAGYGKLDVLWQINKIFIIYPKLLDFAGFP